MHFSSKTLNVLAAPCILLKFDALGRKRQGGRSEGGAVIHHGHEIAGFQDCDQT